MESFTPQIGERVYFYGNSLLSATLIEIEYNMGLFLFDNGAKWCYGLPLPLNYKILKL